MKTWSPYLFRSFTTLPGDNVDVEGPGLVQDGTQCGNGMACLSQRCVPVSQITTMPCETTNSNSSVCSGNGVSHRMWYIAVLSSMMVGIFRCATIVQHVPAMWALRVLAVRHLLQDQEVSSIILYSVHISQYSVYTSISLFYNQGLIDTFGVYKSLIQCNAFPCDLQLQVLNWVQLI